MLDSLSRHDTTPCINCLRFSRSACVFSVVMVECWISGWESWCAVLFHTYWPWIFIIYLRYLNSISFAFPLVLMIAWVLFIANFVKKLVHERELRLHEVSFQPVWFTSSLFQQCQRSAWFHSIKMSFQMLQKDMLSFPRQINCACRLSPNSFSEFVLKVCRK